MDLLDTNIIGYLLRGDLPVHYRLAAARADGIRVVLSAPVEYEVRRGLMRRNAHRQLERFEELLVLLEYAPFERSVWLRAAELWVHSRDRGEPIADADLLIAAHALELDATLVTNNVAHYRVFEAQGLRIDNWMAA